MNDTFDPKAFKKPQRLSAQADPSQTFDPGAIKQKIQTQTQAEEDLLTAPLGPVPTWSFSRLMQYESCPYSIYLKSVKKCPDPSGPAAERGTLVHDHIERYIQNEHDALLAVPLLPGMKKIDLTPFEPLIERLRKGWIADKVEVEGDWGFTRDWQQTGFFADDVWLRMKLDAIEFESETSAVAIDWKGLALDTLLPTPSGWTTMAQVQEGDVLFGSDGRPCRVVGKSEVHHRPCYRITFEDKVTVVADDEHLWALEGHGVVSTRTLAELRQAGDTLRAKVAAPLETEYAPLPLDPYLLGLWLADGKHTSGEICKPDQEVWDKVTAHGYGLGKTGRADRGSEGYTRTVLGLRVHLNHLGLLGNKHIPARYLRASYPQRLDLLRGLMDGDGNANPTRGQAIFTTTDKALSDQVVELLASLGQRPLQSTVTANGFGKTVTAYPISFRPTDGLRPFYLTRKAEPLEGMGNGHSKHRRILTVEEVDSVPTQCIAVDSPDHTYLCTEKMIVTHNTGRKFGNELKHNQQGMSYAIGAFMRYPKLEFIETQFVYLDQKEAPLTNQYTRDRAMLLKPMWDKRANRLTTATEFPPKPSMQACRWCPHAVTQEGFDEPACAFRFQEL